MSMNKLLFLLLPLFLSACTIHRVETQKRDIPLTLRSDISIVGVTNYYDGDKYQLSNGVEVDRRQLQTIRALSERYGNDPRVTELLSWMRIEYDAIAQLYEIYPRFTGAFGDHSIYNYIVLRDDEAFLRLKLKFTNNDWLFVDSFVVAADDYRWNSPSFEFTKDNNATLVWEWINVLPDEKLNYAIEKLCEADVSYIRFYGQKYKMDWEVSDRAKRNLRDIRELYRRMEEIKQANNLSLDDNIISKVENRYQ